MSFSLAVVAYTLNIKAMIQLKRYDASCSLIDIRNTERNVY